MMKKLIALLFVTILSLSLVACGGKNEPSDLDSIDGNPVEYGREYWEEKYPGDPNSTETDAGTDSNVDTQTPQNSEIAKINGGADEVGIYSTVVRLTDKAADKGVVEMVYYGAKGSPQENSIVNTFRIEYYKEEAGTFEIQTFFNGEVYQNQHHKEEVKVVNTFDATLRAGNVIITYTPDGGEAQEIFSADADYFNASSK